MNANPPQTPPEKSGFDLSPPSAQQRQALEADLSAEERRVLLNHGTEAAFCGGLLDNKEPGVYACRLCGLPLFSAQAKFNSGTGWPASPRRSPKDIWHGSPIAVMAWSAPRSAAAVAEAIRVMSSRTDRRPAVCASASIRSRCSSCPNRSRCPIRWAAATNSESSLFGRIRLPWLPQKKHPAFAGCLLTTCSAALNNRGNNRRLNAG